MASDDDFLLVRYGDGCVEVSLAGLVRGTQLAEAAYLKLGLDKDNVALHRVQLFHVVDGARGGRFHPLETGGHLPLPGATVEAAVLPVMASAGSGASQGAGQFLEGLTKHQGTRRG